ncbi:MAG TPA: DUF1028 domain-containing protein [Dehalococcoidia bacterium]|nr:DUF1028 domain-containing protein [Dehalococcoidia bacterium]
MTFSIVARDMSTGAFGVAVSTAVPCVGALCPHVRPGVGAIATQSYVNVALGTDGLALLAMGLSPEAALRALLSEDAEASRRQWGGVDARGRVFAFSGDDCVEWFGAWPEPERQYSVQGNMLVGPEVVEAMAKAYEASLAAPLPERLVRALEAGQAAGGDKRGRVSAALLTTPLPGEAYGYDIRVDEHADPVRELRRIYEIVSARRAEARR